MSVSVEVKSATRTVGEGPYWEESSQSLLYVDLMFGDIHRYTPATRQDQIKSLGKSNISVVIPSTKGGYLISHGRALENLDWESGRVTKVYSEVDKGTENVFNDGKCDASGRLWIGTMGKENSPMHFEMSVGSLYSVERDGHTIRRHLENIDISNGIAWTADNSVMFYNDTMQRSVYAFDFDIDAGTIRKQRVAVKFRDPMEDGVGPDGMCMDAAGKLWIACPGAGIVSRYDPETGQKIQKVDFPVKGITSCCFGGKHNDELYVTSVGPERTLPENLTKQPLAGSLFKVTGLGVKGGSVYQFDELVSDDSRNDDDAPQSHY